MKVTIKELTIESDADFSHVNIDFSNGAMTATPGTSLEPEKIQPVKEEILQTPSYRNNDVALDLDETFETSEEVVEKPVIEETKREVKVSDDMMNAEF